MNNELIYIDTNIYIDYFENRTDRLRPLGEFAYNLLRKCIECEYKIIISSLVIDELEFNSYEENIKALIKDLKELDKLQYIEVSDEDDIKAEKLRQKLKTPLNDTKHAVLAGRANAGYFVTRNIRDFEKLDKLVRPKYPESL